VEVLTPDFQGREESVEKVLAGRPRVYGHNLETVRRLTPLLRSGADYDRSLEVLRRAARRSPEITAKSALLLGLGETDDEIAGALEDLRQAGVSIVHLGQYLQPSARQEPVRKYYPPEEFDRWGGRAREMGFSSVQSGPLVRSSYHARP
jgi:lipoic acid synthetase